MSSSALIAEAMASLTGSPQLLLFDALRPEERLGPHGLQQAREMLETSYAWLDNMMATREWAAATASASPIARPRRSCSMPTGRIRSVRRIRTSPRTVSGCCNGRRSRAVDEARPYRAFFPLGAPDRD
jgi:glutathione S-transferase